MASRAQTGDAVILPFLKNFSIIVYKHTQRQQGKILYSRAYRPKIKILSVGEHSYITSLSYGIIFLE